MARASFLFFTIIAISVARLGVVSAGDSRLQVVEFSSVGCAPCKSMQPILAKLAMEGWEIQELDVAKEASLVRRFEVKSVPTVIMILDGVEVDRVVGALGYEKLRARFEKASHSEQSRPLVARNELAGRELAGRDVAAELTLSPPHSSTPNSSTPSLATGGWARGQAATVRGQSPTITAFPLLGAQAFGSIDESQSQDVAASTVAAASNAQSVDRFALDQTQSAGGAVAADARGMSEFSLAQPQSQPQPQPQPQQLLRAQETQRRGGQAPSADAIARAQAATVRIRVEEANSFSFGTGTVISVHGTQALVLTCGHLFRDNQEHAKLSVEVFQNGRPIVVPATVVAFNAKEYDLGLIEFQLPIPIAPVPVASLADQPQPGDVAFSFGCDHGADPTRRDTQIKRVNRYLGAANVEIHGAPVVGRSGGGLFDGQGRLVGVCNASDEEDDEGIYAALPTVHQHLIGLNLSELTSGSSGSLASAAASPTNQLATSSTATVQLASSSTSASAPARLATNTQPDYWPDQANANAAMVGITKAAQVECVIRDARGQESKITIDHASEELIAALRQHATR